MSGHRRQPPSSLGPWSSSPATASAANGSCYVADAFARRCQDLELTHGRTRPYRPRTNGKADRFIQTLLREWAYAFPFNSSAQRSQLLPRYLHFYNHHRAYAALARQPPISRLMLNNLVRNYS